MTIGFQGAGGFATGNGTSLISDVVNFQGTGVDTFVLQIDYNEGSLTAGESAADLYLAWLDPSTQTWENAVLGNTGNSVPRQIIGAYDPALDFVLGDYGVDPVDGRVWAVLDHNSTFGAVGTQAVPEPATWAMEGFAMLALAGLRRRRG